MDAILVSVIIPFFKYRKWLEEAIISVLGQTHKNIEVIVVNDGSPENIDDLKKKYLGRVRFYEKKNGGAASARNYGLSTAEGQYIAFLDSDDIFAVDKIERQLKYMLETGVAWSQHSYYKRYDCGKKVLVDTSRYNGDVYRSTFTSFRVQTSTVMVIRQALIRDGIRFPENFKNGQDGEFYKALAAKNPLGYVPNAYSDFRIRGANVGFNPEVLLRNKSQIWKELEKTDHYPREVDVSIRLCHLLGHKAYCVHSYIVNNFAFLRPYRKMIAFLLYLSPFISLKIVHKFDGKP